LVRTAGNPIIDVGAELKHPPFWTGGRRHFHSKERRIVHDDPDFLHWSDQEVFVAFPFEHRGEQLHQRQPADRRFLIEPRTVGGDPHLEVSAKWLIPARAWRQPPALAG